MTGDSTEKAHLLPSMYGDRRYGCIPRFLSAPSMSAQKPAEAVLLSDVILITLPFVKGCCLLEGRTCCNDSVVIICLRRTVELLLDKNQPVIVAVC